MTVQGRRPGESEALSDAERTIHGCDEETVADTVGEHSIELGPAPVDARRPGLLSAHNRKIVILPFVVALVFFFGPAVAFLFGNRATEIDNRPLVALPSPTQGWDFFAKFQAWANDYLPLRAEAVRAGTLLSETIFGEPPQYGKAPAAVGVPGVAAQVPGADDAGSAAGADGQGTAGAVVYPQVIGGKNGWLYLGSDAAAVCQPEQPVDHVVANLQRLSGAITASGRKAVLVIPPDKSSVVPQYLPDTFAGKACMATAKKEFWDEVAATPGLTVLDPRADLAATEQEWGESVWRKSDTHWGPRGALTFAQEVVGAIDPAALADSDITSPGQKTMPGDLSAMTGNPTDDTMKDVTLTRPGVALSVDGVPTSAPDIPSLDFAPLTVTAESTQAPLVPGRTVVLGDSFFEASKSMLAPYFESMTYLHNMTADAPGGLQGVVDTMVDSDTVVIEVVERAAVGGAASIQQDAAVDAMVAALAADPR